MSDLNTQFAAATEAWRNARKERQAAIFKMLKMVADHPKFPEVFEAYLKTSVALNDAYDMQKQLFEQIQMERKKS